MSDLKQWIDANGLTQVSAAERLGITQSQVSRFCRGKTRPRPEVAAQLETVTGIPAWEFIKPAEHLPA